MKLFEKKRRPGRKQEKLGAFPQYFAVSNYRPAAYAATAEWESYEAKAEKRFRRSIAAARPDDLCAAMFDADIEANALLVKTAAQVQRIDHLQTIGHNQSVLQGCRKETQGCLRDLRQDLAELEAELEKLQGKGDPCP